MSVERVTAGQRSDDKNNRQRYYFFIFVVICGLTLGSLMRSSSATSYFFEITSYDSVVDSIVGGVSGGQGSSSSSAANGRLISFTVDAHRKEVQEALEKYIQAESSPVLTSTDYQTEGAPPKRVDLTKNYPRIQDYVNDLPSRVERTVYTGAKNESSASASETEKKDDEPLNIVIFYADDWTMKVLGVLNEHVSTPNLDEMARNGMVFTSNCVTTSICWISRNTFATGVYAAVHRNVKIASTDMFNGTVQWPLTLWPQLKANGYYTGLVGKWHAPSPREFMSYTFDKMNIYYGKHWMQRNGERRHVTDCNGEDAIQFLRTRPPNKKFALTVNFFATHAVDYTDPPYQPMEESMPLYANDTLPRPKTATEDHWRRLPWFFNDHNEGRRRWKDRFDTEENYQDKLKNLYRLASEVDSVVGAVVDELKSQRVYDKTFLLFTTDNGNLHGEHGLAEKWYPWEESIRVPLVIQDPRMPVSQRGTFNEEFTLSVDLAPTVLSAAKVPAPAYMQGRDIAPLYLQPEETAKTWRQGKRKLDKAAIVRYAQLSSFV